MKYNLNSLSESDFEYLSQALAKTMFGPGTITFGEGPDGGREATFRGEAAYPSVHNRWKGYFVIQAKYKSVRTHNEGRDVEWLGKVIKDEINGYDTRKTKVEKPDNLVFFTNIILTPVAGTGGRDKLDALLREWEKKSGIAHIAVIGYDDIVDLLNLNRDVAVSFSSFILPGDILNQLYWLLNKEQHEKARLNEYFSEYLETEFRSNITSKLEHAGKLTSDGVSLEKVFIDLYATPGGNSPADGDRKFIEKIIVDSNVLLKPSLKRKHRYVLIAGPGYGKSTLTQFLCQVYRAYFLTNIDDNSNPLSEVVDFVNDVQSIIPAVPRSIRFPFRVILKDYAGWMVEQEKKKEPVSLLVYLTATVNKRCGDTFCTTAHIKELLSTLSSLIVFDGLDEVPSSSNRSQLLEEINQFTEVILRRLDADCLIIGTSRPQGYSKEFDSNSYQHLIVSDLTPTDCSLYMSKLLKNIETDDDKRADCLEILIRALDDSIVQRLMRSPLQASIMTILVRSGGEPPRNKYELFTEYYHTVFKREKQKNVADILNKHSDYVSAIHARLGFKLQVIAESADNPSASISLDEFRRLIIEYLKEDVGLDMPEVQDLSDRIIEAVIERLVLLEEVQDNQIGFSIRSVQEFFAANYYMQQPDSVIRERIQGISKSSYWRNTLIFSIGYLFKYKEYLIDHVESVCNELNGSEQSYKNELLSSFYFHGSWLSLDILNEGIFRGHPKYENKFSKNLRHLLEIPFINKHIELSKLPESIRERWLDKFIMEGLQGSIPQIHTTSWLVFCMLHDNSADTSVHDVVCYWPKDANKSRNLFLLLYRNKIFRPPLLKEIVIEAIVSAGHLDYFHYISEDDYLDFYWEVFEETDSWKLRSEIFAAFYLKYLRGQYLPLHIRNKLRGFLLKMCPPDIAAVVLLPISNILVDDSQVKDVEIDGYGKKIVTWYNAPLKNIGIFRKIAEMYGTPYLSCLADFLESPQISTLTKLAESLSLVKGYACYEIKDLFCQLNWVLKWTLKDMGFSINEEPQKMTAGFYDERTWQLMERGVDAAITKKEWPLVLKMAMPEFTRGGSILEQLSYFIEKVVEYDFEPYVSAEFMTILTKINYSEQQKLRDYFHNDDRRQAVLLEVLENGKNEAGSYSMDMQSLYCLVVLLSKRNFVENYQRIDSLFKGIKIVGYLYIDSDESAHDIVKMILDLYLSVNKMVADPSVIRFIPKILAGSFFGKSEVEVNTEVFKLINDVKIEENVFAVLSLMLVSLQKTDVMLENMKHLFLKLNLTHGMINELLVIIRKHNINKNLDWLLLFLGEKMAAEYLNPTSYLNIVANYVESQASTVGLLMKTEAH